MWFSAMASDGKVGKGDAHSKSVSLEASPSAYFDGKGDVIPSTQRLSLLLKVCDHLKAAARLA